MLAWVVLGDCFASERPIAPHNSKAGLPRPSISIDNEFFGGFQDQIVQISCWRIIADFG